MKAQGNQQERIFLTLLGNSVSYYANCLEFSIPVTHMPDFFFSAELKPSLNSRSRWLRFSRSVKMVSPTLRSFTNNAHTRNLLEIFSAIVATLHICDRLWLRFLALETFSFDTFIPSFFGNGVSYDMFIRNNNPSARIF